MFGYRTGIIKCPREYVGSMRQAIGGVWCQNETGAARGPVPADTDSVATKRHETQRNQGAKTPRRSTDRQLPDLRPVDNRHRSTRPDRSVLQTVRLQRARCSRMMQTKTVGLQFGVETIHREVTLGICATDEHFVEAARAELVDERDDLCKFNRGRVLEGDR